MASYIMFGKYSSEGIRQISKARTNEVSKVITQCGGQLRGGYAMLGDKDLALITEFPGNEHAIKASVQLAKTTGIAFTCTPVVTIEEFDSLVG